MVLCHASSPVISISIFQIIPPEATDCHRHELVEIMLCQTSADPPATSECCCKFCCDQTMLELLLADHLVRSLLEESVLNDGVRVIDGRGLQKASSAWDDRCTRCDTLVFRARPTQAKKLRTRISFFKLCVPFASLFESFWRSQHGRVSVTRWVRALMQQLRQSFLHLCTVVNRLAPTDIGTSVRSQEVVAPIWKLNTVYVCLSFRIDRFAKTAPLCRSRLHIGGARPNDRV